MTLDLRNPLNAPHNCRQLHGVPVKNADRQTVEALACVLLSSLPHEPLLLVRRRAVVLAVNTWESWKQNLELIAESMRGKNRTEPAASCTE